MWVLTGDKPGGSLALLPQNACCTWGAAPAAGLSAMSPGVGHVPRTSPVLLESFIVTITQPGGDPFTPLETHLP